MNQQKSEHANGAKEILAKDIPQDIIEDTARSIRNYSVGIVSYYAENQAPRTELLGSGTLVEKDGKYGILTAAHVIDPINYYSFKRAERIGLILTDYSHHWSVEKEHLTYDLLAYKTDSVGPDLGIIRIPDFYVSRLTAKKSFWNLSKFRKEIMKNPSPLNKGMWTVFGCPSVSIEQHSPDKNFLQRISVTGLIGYSGIEDVGETNGYDYYNLLISYDEIASPPSSFAGVSGGGLWHIILTLKDDGTIISHRPILSGVAFYQTEVKNGDRVIICHGRNSIYDSVYSRI